jgi:hypothetical protein
MMALRLIYRLCVWFAVLFACQAAVYSVLKRGTVSEEIRSLGTYLEGGVDIVYLGDSTVKYIAPEDEDRRSLGEMVQALVPGAGLGVVAHDGYHAAVFEDYCRYMVRGDVLPCVVIVPINLRSFSPLWDQQPAWQFEKERYVLRHPSYVARVLRRPLAVFGVVGEDPLSIEEFLALPVYVGDEQTGTTVDFGVLGHGAAPAHAAQIQGRYQYRLKLGHRRLTSFVDIACLLVEHGITPVLYITPIDCQAGERYHGGPFMEQVAENVGTIQAALGQVGASALDLSHLCKTEEFCYMDFVNEHLDEKGRRRVAERLAEAVRAGLARDAPDTPK